MRDKLNQLAKIAEMIKEAELARLSQARSARQQFSDQSKALRTARKATYALPADDTARLTGTDIRWQIWADGRLRQLATLEARAASIEEDQKNIARKAFGRATALDALSKKVSD